MCPHLYEFFAGSPRIEFNSAHPGKLKWAATALKARPPFAGWPLETASRRCTWPRAESWPRWRDREQALPPPGPDAEAACARRIHEQML